MKKLILISIVSTLSLSVFAQATVDFIMRLGGTTHVWGGGSSQIQGNSSIDTPSGTTSYAGLTLIGTGGLTGQFGAATTMAQLLGASGANQPESSLFEAVSPATTFRTGLGSGDIAGRTATFNNILPDALAGTFEMVAWDNNSGLYSTWALASIAWQNGLLVAGKSALFNLQNIGGNVNVPPNIEPAMQSFNIYATPEPTTFGLAGLGAAALMIFRRRKN